MLREMRINDVEACAPNTATADAMTTMPRLAIQSIPQMSFHTYSPLFRLNTPMLITFPARISFGEVRRPPDTQSVSDAGHWHSGTRRTPYANPLSR